ncbi:hypothetical protein FHS27_006285 [Rhodopirellula rubra]|uniref:EF-hand domain-containing protein n=2 Tax=Aporhodopirellula rubra TaxID=980271 RepID=A0A7W5E5C6_9BACT|nr:hypothetical protein [Aporhodopirellula rubra]
MMKTFSKLLCGLAVFATTGYAYAQPPGGRGQGGGRGFDGGGSPVDRMMAMDANGDGQLTPNEVTDTRMKTMLNRADTNQDGIVTRAELTTMVEQFAGGGNRGRGGERNGAGGPPNGGQGGPPNGMMRGGAEGGPPPIGQIIPPFVAEELGLTSAQQAALAELQAEVDARLAAILTDEQQQKLQQGPGGQRGGPPGGGPQGFGERGKGRQGNGR